MSAAKFLAPAPEGMGNWVFGVQKVACKKLSVRREKVTTVLCEVVIPVTVVTRGQFVPGHFGVIVVNRVQIVVEKQQGKRAAALDDDSTLARDLVRAVFGECANF